MAVMTAVTAVLLHHSAIDIKTYCSLLVQGRGEMAVMTAVTIVLLHQFYVDTGTGCNVVSTG